MAYQRGAMPERPAHHRPLERAWIPTERRKTCDFILARTQYSRAMEPQQAALPEHPGDLPQASLKILDMFEHTAGQHHIEGACGKGELLHRPLAHSQSHRVLGRYDP
jgi:hypothetical protein